MLYGHTVILLLNVEHPSSSPQRTVSLQEWQPYKACHGALVFEGIDVHPASIFPGCLSPDGFRRAAQEFAKHAAREKTYGHTQLPNTIEFAGSRMVGVGGNIYAVVPTMMPINFMAELLVTTLGKEWFAAELVEAKQAVHPIISWYRDAMAWQQNNADGTGFVRAVMSGPASAWYLLAYDVWVLQHNSLLAPLGSSANSQGVPGRTL